jgi:hypothetical protein
MGELDARMGDARMGELDARIGELDARVGELDARVGELDARIRELRAIPDARITKSKRDEKVTSGATLRAARDSRE